MKIIYKLLYNYILLNEFIAYYILNKVKCCLLSIIKYFNIPYTLFICLFNI